MIFSFTLIGQEPHLHNLNAKCCALTGYVPSEPRILLLWQSRSLNMPQNSGVSSRGFGKSTFPRRATFLDQNLTCSHPTRCTKQTFFSYLTTNYHAPSRFSNVCLPLSMWQAFRKKLSAWPQKILTRSQKLFRQFVNVALWIGLSWCWESVHGCCHQRDGKP